MRALVVVVVSSWVVLCGCSSSRVQVLPSLTPVDATRPFFVYKAVKGTACGDNAIGGAMDDLYRVAGDAHGFVSATIEQQLCGDRCVTITARPITYGCTAAEPKKLDVYPMHVVPGPTECAAAVDTCTPDCTRYGAALAGGEFETKAFRERCVTRCRAADAAFMTCARAATAAADVRRCDALP
ncbi:MAG: hypothetical protein Q8L48_39155 [Archangium sp.]|nr:hypothetical protein [Archangium sp.]